MILAGDLDAALDRAARFLLRRQSPDGAWRSPVYGTFRDGPSLTPHVVSSLLALSPARADVRAAAGRGIEYLAGLVGADGAIHPGATGLAFPVYTSALAMEAMARSASHAAARAAWLAFLRAHRLGPTLGWRPADPEFGGWGYCVTIPRKPAPPSRLRDVATRPLLLESNLSSTLYGLEALRAAKVPRGDPAYREALVFVQRCQNFVDEARHPDPRFDDGGFFFRPGDGARNKAGLAGTDKLGRTRYRSYGGMTADGLRALLLCGLPPSHPRVVAARRWLQRRFSARANPGAFAPDREVIRNATYYYYCRSVARAFSEPGLRALPMRAGIVPWPEALARELIARQQPDGSWVNPYRDTKEDDPLVATPAAIDALVHCRRM